MRLTGLLAIPEGARGAVLMVHGLGGIATAAYTATAARAAHAAGLASLRLNMRGADGSGEDVYHAGLTQDLRAALLCPELAAFDVLYVLGFSLGGHLTLRLAAEGAPRRVRALAAICPPLDLAAGQRFIDHPRRWIYRQHLLKQLKQGFVKVSERGHHPSPLATVRRARSIRAWDQHVIVPRFGFDSVEHYYESQSVAPQLKHIDTPTLLVASPYDPMVEADVLRHALSTASAALEQRWIEDGGHVYFPSRVGLDDTVIGWLATH